MDARNPGGDRRGGDAGRRDLALLPHQAAAVGLGRVLAEAQRIADVATAMHHVSPVTVTVVDADDVAGEWHPETRIIGIKRSAFERPSWWPPILAHELGHATLNHGRYLGTDPRVAEQRELDANARAVEILVRVTRRTQSEAVALFIEECERYRAKLEASARALGDRIARYERGNRSFTSTG